MPENYIVLQVGSWLIVLLRREGAYASREDASDWKESCLYLMLACYVPANLFAEIYDHNACSIECCDRKC